MADEPKRRLPIVTMILVSLLGITLIATLANLTIWAIFNALYGRCISCTTLLDAATAGRSSPEIFVYTAIIGGVCALTLVAFGLAYRNRAPNPARVALITGGAVPFAFGAFLLSSSFGGDLMLKTLMSSVIWMAYGLSAMCLFGLTRGAHSNRASRSLGIVETDDVWFDARGSQFEIDNVGGRRV